MISILEKVKKVFKLKQPEIFYSPTLDSNFALYGISKEAYEYYINNVNNNLNDDLYTAKRKLTRNVLSSQPIFTHGDNLQRYVYGNLIITVDKLRHEIVWLKNHKNGKGRNYIPKYTINFALKEELNDVMGLK